MACKTHPDRDSVAICMTCREELCDECRQVGADGKSYCAEHLPAAQPPAAPAQEVEMPPRSASAPVVSAGWGNESAPLAALCYLCWILTPLSFLIPIIVLATDYKNSRYMRYHGYNGLFWGIAVVVIMGALRFGLIAMRIIGMPGILRSPLELAWWLVGPVALVVSILFAVKANNREDVNIPVITDLARKQAG